MAVAAGVWTGRAVAPERSAGSPPTRVVRVGAATLVVPQEWRIVPGRGGELIGSRAGTTAVLATSPGTLGQMIVTVAPADDVSLVPRPLRGLVADVPREPRPIRLAGHRAWLYSALPGHTPDRVVDVTTLPSVRGVLGIACVSASSASESSATGNCAASVTSVSFGGSATLVPSPHLAFYLRLPAVLSALDSARVRARGELRYGEASDTRRRMARRLAREHRAAADALRPLAGRAEDQLVDLLSKAAGAYDVLGRAASGRSAPRFDAAREEVDAADAALGGAVEHFATVDKRMLRVQANAGARQPAEKRKRSPAVAILLTAAICLLGVATVGAFVERWLIASVSRTDSDRANPAPTARNASVRGAVGAPPRHAGAPLGRWDAPPTPRPATAVIDEPHALDTATAPDRRGDQATANRPHAGLAGTRLID